LISKEKERIDLVFSLKNMAKVSDRLLVSGYMNIGK